MKTAIENAITITVLLSVCNAVVCVCVVAGMCQCGMKCGSVSCPL